MGKKVSWIKVVDDENAGGALRAVHDRVRGAGGQLDNLHRAMGLRPHILDGADRLYRAILHDKGNSLTPWLGELIATYVGILNRCAYTTAHHGRNFATLFDAADKAAAILAALHDEIDPPFLDPCARAALGYCEKLTRTPDRMIEQDVDRLRRAGIPDGDILEINQIVANFAYWTRTANGLGIGLAGERLGYDV